MLMLVMNWLFCFAFLLEMAYRAPLIDDWGNQFTSAR